MEWLGIRAGPASVANVLLITHDPKGIERLPPDSDRIPKNGTQNTAT